MKSTVRKGVKSGTQFSPVALGGEIFQLNIFFYMYMCMEAAMLHLGLGVFLVHLQLDLKLG